jgi:hypothetical protein
MIFRFVSYFALCIQHFAFNDDGGDDVPSRDAQCGTLFRDNARVHPQAQLWHDLFRVH